VYSVFIRTTPEWQSDAFMIESIPGWRYGPKEPDDSANTLISFNSDSPQSYKKWTNVIEDFLSEYTNTRRHANNVVLCDYDRFPRPGSVCIPEYKDWFPCTKENNFGFDKSSPCVFIRFNKITNWTPVYYNNSSELPADMPENLKQAIKGYYSTYRNLMKTVWLSCEGETPADVENAGPIMYIPSLGFPGYYFPHNNTKNYVSPMVAIHFERPRTGVLINIECRVWAPNIEYNQEKGRGFVHFELMIN
jgi:sodium/potassium-transporting ATPase subunit beta